MKPNEKRCSIIRKAVLDWFRYISRSPIHPSFALPQKERTVVILNISSKNPTEWEPNREQLSQMKLKTKLKQINIVFSFILESCSRFGYHSVEFLREMFKTPTLLLFIGRAKLGYIGDRDTYLNQSGATFLFILHIFSFGFIYSGGFWVDLLRFLFSILGWRQQAIDSKLLVVDHKYRSFFSFFAPPSTAFVLCLLTWISLVLLFFLYCISFHSVSGFGFRVHPSARVSVCRGGGGDHPTWSAEA